MLQAKLYRDCVVQQLDAACPRAVRGQLLASWTGALQTEYTKLCDDCDKCPLPSPISDCSFRVARVARGLAKGTMVYDAGIASVGAAEPVVGRTSYRLVDGFVCNPVEGCVMASPQAATIAAAADGSPRFTVNKHTGIVTAAENLTDTGLISLYVQATRGFVSAVLRIDVEVVAALAAMRVVNSTGALVYL